VKEINDAESRLVAGGLIPKPLPPDERVDPPEIERIDAASVQFMFSLDNSVPRVGKRTGVGL
jgi:hypothetical protein